MPASASRHLQVDKEVVKGSLVSSWDVFSLLLGKDEGRIAGYLVNSGDVET